MMMFCLLIVFLIHYQRFLMLLRILLLKEMISAYPQTLCKLPASLQTD